MAGVDQHSLRKLKDFEKTLSNLLEKIDKEINQTEVEWLHLKDLSECVPQGSRQPPVKTELTQVDYLDNPDLIDLNLPLPKKPKIKEEFYENTPNHQIKLDLNPDASTFLQHRTYNEEEFDSD